MAEAAAVGNEAGKDMGAGIGVACGGFVCGRSRHDCVLNHTHGTRVENGFMTTTVYRTTILCS